MSDLRSDRHAIRVRRETPASRSEPAGVGLCEIRQTILPAGAPAPTDPSAVGRLTTEPESPHRTDFDSEEVGDVAYYAGRSLSTRGEPGPWGMITSYPVV